MLPLISFVDKPLSLKYSWWVPNSTKVPQVVKDMMTSLNSKIADQFSTIEFYSMRPILGLFTFGSGTVSYRSASTAR